MYEEINKKTLRDVHKLMKNYCFHIQSYRVIKKCFAKLAGDKEFWAYTCDAHLLNATLCWCKIFGSDSENTHWKKIFIEREKEPTKNNFCKYLEKEGINIGQWGVVHKDMLKFRNEYVAHTSNYDDIVPYFDKASKILHLFDRWLRETLIYDKFEFKMFFEIEKEYAEKIEETLKKCSNERIIRCVYGQ